MSEELPPAVRPELGRHVADAILEESVTCNNPVGSLFFSIAEYDDSVFNREVEPGQESTNMDDGTGDKDEHGKQYRTPVQTLVALSGTTDKSHTAASSDQITNTSDLSSSIFSNDPISNLTPDDTNKPTTGMLVPQENKYGVQRKSYLLRNQAAAEEHMTSSQKDQLISDLRREVFDLQQHLEQTHNTLTAALDGRSLEAACVVTQKEAELQAMTDTVRDLKAELERKEAEHQEMYFIMYKKGEHAATFDRQQSVEAVASRNPQAVTVAELLDKLNATQSQLTHWQNLRRRESYEEGLTPDTEAEATLRFLHDSMFHYLTDPRDDDQKQHLRAIISMLGYSDEQMKKINKERERKGSHK